MLQNFSVHTLIFLFGILILSSCSKTMDTSEIQKLNAELQSPVEASLSPEAQQRRQAIVNELLLKIAAFLKNAPDHIEAGDWAFRQGELTFSELQDTRKAATLLEAVSRNYPGTEAGAKALFLSAFLHNNELGNVTLAQNLYSKFIREYPEHPFVKDAKLEIQYIGKTPEEILEASQNSNSDK